LDVQKILCGPEEYDEVAEGVLRRVEVVDCFDVEALRILDMLEYLPVGAGGPGSTISLEDFEGVRFGKDVRALEQGHKEAGDVQGYRVEKHDATEPLVQF